MAVGGPEGDVIITRFPDGDQATRIPFSRRIRLVTYSPDGRYLAIRLLEDGAVEVGTFAWGVVAFDRIGNPIGHPAVRSGGEFNTLLVILRGGRNLEIYVNGTAISKAIQLEQGLASADPSIMSWSRRAEFTRYTVWPAPPGTR